MSGGGLDSLGGEVGSAGRMKWGRCGADVDTGVVAATVAMLGNGAGVRGGGTLKRCVVGAGVWGSGSSCCDGELGGDVRRRLVRAAVSKSISSLPSSSPSNASSCDPSMLSMRSNFLGSFGRGVVCSPVSSPSLPLPCSAAVVLC